MFFDFLTNKTIVSYSDSQLVDRSGELTEYHAEKLKNFSRNAKESRCIAILGFMCSD